MGTNIREVGGGPSTGMANDFVSWLQNGLNSGSFGGNQVPSSQPQSFLPRQPGESPGDFSRRAQNRNQGSRQTTPADAFGRANPVASTQGVSGVINQTLAGQPPSTQYGADLSGLTTHAGSIQPFNFGSFNPQLADFGSFYNPLNGYSANNQIGAPSSIAGNNQLQGFLSSLGQLGNQSQSSMFDLSRQFGTAQAQGPFANVKLDTPDLSAYIPQLERENAKSLADMRARFGASGGASFGTPAAFAEGNLTAEQSARNAVALADIGRAQQGMGLQRDALNSNNWNTFAGNDLQAQLGNQGLNANMFSNLLGNQTQALQAGGSILGNALGQDAGNQLQASMANASNNLNALTNQGNMTLDQLRAQSTQGLNAQGLQNDFQGMQANNQLNAQTLQGNLMNMIAGLTMQGQGMNQQQNQFNSAQQQNMLSQLMQLFQNMSMPGIAQRQNIATPSAGANILGAATGLAGAALPFAMPGLRSTPQPAIPYTSAPNYAGRVTNNPFGPP